MAVFALQQCTSRNDEIERFWTARYTLAQVRQDGEMSMKGIPQSRHLLCIWRMAKESISQRTMCMKGFNSLLKQRLHAFTALQDRSFCTALALPPCTMVLHLEWTFEGVEEAPARLPS